MTGRAYDKNGNVRPADGRWPIRKAPRPPARPEPKPPTPAAPPS